MNSAKQHWSNCREYQNLLYSVYRTLGRQFYHFGTQMKMKSSFTTQTQFRRLQVAEKSIYRIMNDTILNIVVAALVFHVLFIHTSDVLLTVEHLRASDKYKHIILKMKLVEKRIFLNLFCSVFNTFSSVCHVRLRMLNFSNYYYKFQRNYQSFLSPNVSLISYRRFGVPTTYSFQVWFYGKNNPPSVSAEYFPILIESRAIHLRWTES